MKGAEKNTQVIIGKVKNVTTAKEALEEVINPQRGWVTKDVKYPSEEVSRIVKSNKQPIQDIEKAFKVKISMTREQASIKGP